MTESIVTCFETLKNILTVSGFESRLAGAVKDAVLSLTDGFFHTASVTPRGSLVFSHRCENENAKHLLLDAHFDTVGLVVSQLSDGGFVRCVPVGGIDRRLLPTAEVIFYGKEALRGVFASTPPHLAEKNEKETLPEFSEYLVDTGRTKEELETLLPVGSPAVFAGESARLLNDRYASAHLDDKICCAAILETCRELANEETTCHVTVLFSSGEETGAGGAPCAARGILADGAVALDVNFACDKGVPDYSSAPLGAGAMISRSAVTDRRMTAIVETCACDAAIPHKIIAETEGTGTNADAIMIAGAGTPCAVLSVPLSYMHTPCEVCDLCDVQAVSDLLVQLVRRFDALSREEQTRLGVRVVKGTNAAKGERA